MTLSVNSWGVKEKRLSAPSCSKYVDALRYWIIIDFRFLSGYSTALEVSKGEDRVLLERFERKRITAISNKNIPININNRYELTKLNNTDGRLILVQGATQEADVNWPAELITLDETLVGGIVVVRGRDEGVEDENDGTEGDFGKEESKR